MSTSPSRTFAPPPSPGRARSLPPATIVAGSLLTALPIVARGPVAPPFGLLMLLAWRLLAPGSLRLWAPAALGFADDLVSGQPLGSAVTLWTLAFLALALVDRRLMFRDFRQDWLLASAIMAAALILGRLLATPLSARVDAVLCAQIMASALLFPLAARLCAWIDRRRGAP